jgi:predicted Zn-dependent protease
MAHELGHLLLGAGHTPDGVMQAAWGPKQMDALRQRWLRFTTECATRIRRALEARTAGDAGGK